MDFKADTSTLKTFRSSLMKAAKQVEDLRAPLTSIGQRFFASRRFIFQQSGPGQYKDLSPRYKKWKSVRKQPYPILRLDGHLEKSITNYNDPQAIARVSKTNLEVGTKIKYGAVHQLGLGGLPRRPFLFWGPESRFANESSVKKFNRNMAEILFNHVRRTIESKVNPKKKK